jgi:hypothetical protein
VSFQDLRPLLEDNITSRSRWEDGGIHTYHTGFFLFLRRMSQLVRAMMTTFDPGPTWRRKKRDILSF